MVRSWMFYIPGVRHLAVAGEGDPAVEHIVERLVPRNQVQSCRAKLVGEKDSSGVVLHDVVDHARL